MRPTETDLRQNLMDLLNDPTAACAHGDQIVSSPAPDGMRLLVAALGDSRPRVRRTPSAFEVAAIQCIPLLRPYLRDPDNRVRANVARPCGTSARGGADGAERHVEAPGGNMRLSAVGVGEVRFAGASGLTSHVEGEASPRCGRRSRSPRAPGAEGASVP
jgi:hypothetical protein